MTLTNIQQGSARVGRHEDSTHLFALGQTVRLRSSLGRFPKTAERYHITAKLPPSGNSPQYRIRNDEERHERMTTQDSLEAIDTSVGNDETLIERTFGNGQGTETQQPRDQKAEAGKGSAQA